MKAQCVMCGRDISQGILCEKCDRPKRPAKSGAAAPAAALDVHEELADAAPVTHEDPFPKAPVVPFPLESTTLALTSVHEVLAATGAPSVLIGGDKKIKFISDNARELLGVEDPEMMSVRTLEALLGFTIPESAQSFTLDVSLADRSAKVSVIALSGGAGGHVILFKTTELPRGESADSALMSFVREAVVTPLGALQAALAAAAMRKKEPVLQDAVNTIDQILSSLELAPRSDSAPLVTAPHRKRPAKAAETIPKILQGVADKYHDQAVARGVRLQLDVPETAETFRHADQLAHALGVLVENALHYVPQNGQIVLCLRFLEHKGKPLLLFLVMDNGPVVPEELREKIFEPGFDERSVSGRSGRNLSAAREFAIAHGGQIWVESKTGKACTFFLRVRPDSERA